MKFKLWIRNLLGQFQWYRRKQSGHWERWKLPHDLGFAWFRVSGCCYSRGYGPDPRLKGAPAECEQHWPNNCEYAEYADVVTLPGGLPCPICRKPYEEHAIDVCIWSYNPDPVYRVCTGQLARIKVDPTKKFHSG